MVSTTFRSMQPCKYGAKCYRKNPAHLASYSHPSDDDDALPSIGKRNTKSFSSKSPPTKKQKVLFDENSDSSEEDDSTVKKTIYEFSASESDDEMLLQAPNKTVNKEKVKTKLITNTWTSHDSMLYYIDSNSHNNGKVASFDMDSTIICPKSGRVHPQGRTDWRWLFPCVPKKLKQLHNDGYMILIISNQKGISTGNTTAAAVQGKIADLKKDCGVPLSAMLSTRDDKYRKPSPCMFTFFQEYMTNEDVDMNQSYYIGDAAGRPKDWNVGKKKDFSCSDRKFAANCLLPFLTPEEFFLKEDPVAFDWKGVNPKEIKEYKTMPFSAKQFVSEEQEMILLVGFPASGKTTFAKNYLIPDGYVHVNRDTLHTAARCKNASRDALALGKSVVVDNTNPSPSARSVFIAEAKKLGVPVRCFHFETSEELCKHLNVFREIETEGARKHVPGVGFNVFKKHFVCPSLSEGFKEIKQIQFKRFHHYDSHKSLFELWS